MRFSSSIRPRPQLQPPLDRLEGGPVDDGLVGVLGVSMMTLDL